MIETFTAEIDSPLGPEELKREILTRLSVPFGKGEYRIESVSDSGVTYARTYSPYFLPAVLLSPLLFPLVLLLVQRTDRIVFSIGDRGGQTHLVIVGDGPRRLRRWFEEFDSFLD